MHHFLTYSCVEGKKKICSSSFLITYIQQQHTHAWASTLARLHARTQAGRQAGAATCTVEHFIEV